MKYELGHPEREPAAREEALVAASRSMRDAVGEVDRVASTEWPVLITGPTGVGKELLAQRLHRRSARALGPCIPINSAALHPNLVDSELFGHARGAFTGALRERRGLFEAAHGGTLFLDEVGELSADNQARLLRVLEDGCVRRLGMESVRRLDVRLVCATHRCLLTEVAEKRFREDLYYRIACWVVQVPPLRERPEDVRVLSARFAAQMQCTLSCAALERLVRHAWPGNVRELRNVVSASSLSAVGSAVGATDVDYALRRVSGVQTAKPDALREAVMQSDGNIAAAARKLGMPRSTFRDRLRQCKQLRQYEQLAARPGTLTLRDVDA